MADIYFAGGCFWGIEHLFSLVPGVTDAVSGYANGHTQNPTYKEVCTGTTGHRETVKVTFDKNKVSLEDLLSLYFSVIDPTIKDRQGNDVGSQYQTGIYYSLDSQKPAIETAVAKEKAKHDAFVVEVGPLTAFYPAEDNHQDYLDNNPQGYCHIPFSAFERAKNMGKKGQYQRITPQEAKQQLDENAQAVTLLDVRSQGEFAGGHIAGAINLPLEQVKIGAQQVIPSKDALVYVYCRSGARSQNAAEQLLALGYTNIFDLGGIMMWPYEIVR